MNIKTSLANRGNYGDERALSQIKYIVIHYTANDGDSDEGNANYFKGDRGVSAHYFVDDDSITQSVKDNFIAWAVGGNKYPNCLATGGGAYYGKCTNSNSISIELCDSVKNGKYDFTENTLAQAASLTKELMKRYAIPLSSVIRHFDVTGKSCPGPFVENHKEWEAFKERLAEKEDQELINATRNLVLKGIKINVNSWNNVLLINLNNVEALIMKLGGLTYLKQKGIISNTEIWENKKYSKENVRSLLIKASKML